MIVLHYTGMKSGEEALARLCDPQAKVSAHFLIEEDGRCFQLVAEEHRAWHAGVSHWAGESDINSRSIGIELVNPGHEFGLRPFPLAQMEILALLCKDICARYGVSQSRVLGHSDVALERKADPGELFDWEWLAAQGVGLWPVEVQQGFGDIGLFQEALKEVGYNIEITGIHDEQSRCVTTAFQRRFRPNRIDGDIDLETERRLRGLLEVLP